MSTDDARVTVVSGANRVQLLSWVGFVAGAALLFLMLLQAGEMLGSDPSGTDLVLYMAFGILPAAAATILSLRSRFGWAGPLGIWYLFLGFVGAVDGTVSIITNSMILLSSLVLCLLPFVRSALLRTARRHGCTTPNIPVSAAPLMRLALRERLTAFGNRLER
jgi:hypothetical protein